MNLIPISSNVLVNPEHICSVEQKIIGETTITVVRVYEKDYVLTFPLKDFLEKVEKLDQSKGQHFAG